MKSCTPAPHGPTAGPQGRRYPNGEKTPRRPARPLPTPPTAHPDSPPPLEYISGASAPELGVFLYFSFEPKSYQLTVIWCLPNAALHLNIS